ncbi:hypothetical protein PtA15_11A190 [Puccinia triticina]|uniref:Uncharacterized protein n=1 Tax=Puccinia triticina TaxID=208348 RepID=A0ABY7CZG1_9BASI|nr:uncharacterized protein PtA15_11A190 [Puccinia triticina]WAQ89501.1 hypothetical protein PtA15_11A190 [Puccinia triticina]
MMENPYDPNEESQFHGEESKSTGQQEEYPRWLTMPTAEELEEHIDPSIHSVQEEYRRQAREFNWALLMRELHTWYLILKLHTKNWSSANAFKWLCKKFKLAANRRKEVQKELQNILSLDNPFKQPGQKYTISYFKEQWRHQKTFRADHTDEEQERRDKLIKIYKHQANIELLRQRLMDPDLNLLSEKEVKKIFDKIDKVSKKLNKDAAEAEALGINLPSGKENSDEQRLLLLLWNSKNELYIQAVQLQAERQPLLDAKKLGTRVGTELKEKILKAIATRRPAVLIYSEFNQIRMWIALINWFFMVWTGEADLE